MHFITSYNISSTTECFFSDSESDTGVVIVSRRQARVFAGIPNGGTYDGPWQEAILFVKDSFTAINDTFATSHASILNDITKMEDMGYEQDQISVATLKELFNEFNEIPNLANIVQDLNGNYNDYPENIVAVIDKLLNIIFLEFDPAEPEVAELKEHIEFFRDYVVKWGMNFVTQLKTLDVFILINAFRTGDADEKFLFNIFFTRGEISAIPSTAEQFLAQFNPNFLGSFYKVMWTSLT